MPQTSLKWYVTDDAKGKDPRWPCIYFLYLVLLRADAADLPAFLPSKTDLLYMDGENG